MSKGWPKRELQGLVACEMDGRSTILPIWHGVTRADVLKFSPPLVDKLAAKTENSTAVQIALQILSVIHPDIYAKTPYNDLKRLANGEAIRELQEEIGRVRQALSTHGQEAEYEIILVLCRVGNESIPLRRRRCRHGLSLSNNSATASTT